MSSVSLSPLPISYGILLLQPLPGQLNVLNLGLQVSPQFLQLLILISYYAV